MTDPTRILILGGGFGGIYTALELERMLGRSDGIEVTLVNRDNFFLFTPMLHEVAASDLDLTHIVNPIRKLLKRVRFFAGEAESIDLTRRLVRVWHGEDRHPHELPYDHLVLALGSVTNYYGLPGLAERAMTMKSLGDAIALRNRVIGNLEEADFECCAAVREPLLTFVVAGGGFAGVETAAAIDDFAREALLFYPNLAAGDIRTVLVHSGQVILPELTEKLGRYAQRKLMARGVDVRLGLKVIEQASDHVRLSDGSTIRSCTLVWTAGTAPNPILASLPCALERGRVCVSETLEVPGWPGVWALGDCAFIPDPRTGSPHPPTAQHAIREGRTLARNIMALIRGRSPIQRRPAKPLRPFRFTTIGQLASLGRRTGVASILGVNFSGFLAWWLWRTIYLAKLPRLEKKLRVALDWTLDLFFTKDLVQYQTSRSPLVPRRDARSPDANSHRGSVPSPFHQPAGAATDPGRHQPHVQAATVLR
jgi:NADH dehydrogenase